MKGSATIPSCAMNGRLDTVHAKTFETYIRETIQKEEGAIVVDMAHVDYIASSGAAFAPDRRQADARRRTRPVALRPPAARARGVLTFRLLDDLQDRLRGLSVPSLRPEGPAGRRAGISESLAHNLVCDPGSALRPSGMTTLTLTPPAPSLPARRSGRGATAPAPRDW